MEAAYLLAFFALASQVLALLRDRTFAHVFGVGQELDMYFAAFRMPDLVFAFLTIFVSSFALIPLMSRTAEKERRELVGSVLLIFGVAALGASALLYFLIPTLMPHLVPGFSADATQETVQLARIMLIQPVLLGLSSIAGAYVQAIRQFMLFALAPIFYNVGIIVGVMVLYPEMGLEGLAWGVVLGAALHFGIQAIPLLRAGVALPAAGVQLLPVIRDVVVPSVPRALALMANQSLLIAFASIASLVSVGSVSALSLAFNLQSVPLTVIGVSYASALFPALALLWSSGERDRFQSELWTTVKHILFWLIPATMFFIVLRAHVVRVVLGSGAFSWDDTRITAAVVALFIVSLTAQALILVFSRGFYAAGESRVPIALNVGGSIVAGVLAYVLVVGVANVSFFKFFVESLLRVGDVPGTTVLMIPAAYSISMLCIAGLFGILFARRYGYDRTVMESLGVSFSASIVGAFALYGALYAFGPLLPTNTFLGIFAQGAAAGLVGVVAWVAILFLMKSREFTEVVVLLRDRAARR